MRLALSSPIYQFSHNISHVAAPEWLIHAHSFYEFYYIVDGDTDFLLNGTEYTLSPHTVLLIAPNVYHGIRVRTTRPYERYTLHFEQSAVTESRRPMLLEALFPGSTPENQGVLTGCWPNMRDTGVAMQLRLMEAHQDADANVLDTTTPILLEALLAQMLLYVNEHTTLPAQQAEASQTGAKSAVIAWLDEHFTEPISLDMLSERFFLSKSQLNSLCRKQTGTTLIDYVIRKRLGYAQLMLSNGVSAAEAAEAAGFGDYTSFYRAYTKAFGCSPSKARLHAAGETTLNGFVHISLGGKEHRHLGANPDGPQLWERNTCKTIGKDPSIVHD